MTLGNRLKKLRGKKTQEEVASRVDVSRARYSHYENGRSQPDNEILIKLSNYFGVSVDYLLGGSNTIQQNDTQEYDPLAEINKLIEEYKVEQFGFFDIEKWKKFTPEDVENIRNHFEWLSHKAEERNRNKSKN